ncbi:septum site-determining protein MinC [Candidatus Ishikawella capsulata]|uniref:Probable septum site-determining protein MinC n=1 Tax=Candidatus Ishikawaella capsulata Mpkobe TaxID=476281 RepID=C5WCM5_9ENTR|nr:septum site-determining protein MinC [Candidatus Ishikawaella capsulata]BAH83081.1 septum formation inhibitor [Candidatus Ishikawaella capsulata Mpkobe]
MPNFSIEIKGNHFKLSVVHAYDSEPEILRQALQKKIEQAPEYLKNAPVVINVSRLGNEANWYKLQQAILSTGLRIIGVSGCKNNNIKRMVIKSGVPLLYEDNIIKKKRQSIVNILSQKNFFKKTLIVNDPIRSGQQVYARSSDLIIVNNVSTGAEIIADGNIHIYGMMRGRVLAGANGDKESQIFCTRFAAELVSIAGEYLILEQISSNFISKAVSFQLKEGVISIKMLL